MGILSKQLMEALAIRFPTKTILRMQAGGRRMDTFMWSLFGGCVFVVFKVQIFLTTAQFGYLY
jgi:hypothetical protein